MAMMDRLRGLFGAPAPGITGTAATPVQAMARGAYEAGGTGRRAIDWQTPDVSAAAATASAATIRARCRDAMRNDSWARAIVETLVDDVIGWGIKPLSRAKGEPFRQAAQALHDDWSAVADADGILDYAGLQALAVRQMVVDGECFIRLRRRKKEDGLPVPLQIQILPAEICPPEDTLQRAEAGNRIKQGIEYDAIGRRVAYWLRETPPGEDDVTTSAATVHRVPASQVLHLYEPLRPGQRRGVSMLAPALVRLRELDKYADATLLRLQLASMFVGIVKSTPSAVDDVHPLTGQPAETADGLPLLRMAPGTFQQLGANEALDFNDPPDPPVGFEAFVKHELRAAGAAVGVPLEAFTHDWGSQNDRIARVTLNQYRRRVHRLLWSIVVPQFLRPLWRAWFDLALAGNTLPVDAATYLEDRLGRVTFAPHAHAYVHPVQDVESYKQAIRAGLTSRAAAVSETGEDAEVIDAQNAADNARADALGLRYDSDGRQAPRGTR